MNSFILATSSVILLVLVGTCSSYDSYPYGGLFGPKSDSPSWIAANGGDNKPVYRLVTETSYLGPGCKCHCAQSPTSSYAARVRKVKFRGGTGRRYTGYVMGHSGYYGA